MPDKNGRPVTHKDMATAILILIQSQSLNIPASQSRGFVDILDWLEAIRDGALLVSAIPPDSFSSNQEEK